MLDCLLLHDSENFGITLITPWFVLGCELSMRKVEWMQKATFAPRPLCNLLCISHLFHSANSPVRPTKYCTLSCIMESYRGRLVPWNVYIGDKILIQLNPHTHMGHVRLFRLGCYCTRPDCCSYPVPSCLALAFRFPPGTCRLLRFPQARPASLISY
jgi:hypothetical protein